MQKLTFFLCVVLMPIIGMKAAPIDASRAKKIAEQFSVSVLKNSSSLRLAEVPAALRTGKSGDTRSAYYIFNRSADAGFVVVAGDDLLPEILGYSDKGNIDLSRLNPNLAYWLSTYDAAARYVTTTGKALPAADLRAKADVAPLVTSRWNQDEPYNAIAPMVNGEHGATGCVATATAQIMYFHRWPEVGEGSHAYTERRPTRTGVQKVEHNTTFDTHYAWTDMLDTYTYSSSKASREAVAKLMYDVGMAVDMVYMSNGSGTTSEHVVRALRENFRYIKSVRMLPRNRHSATEWQEIIYQELSDNRPIYYAGGSGLEGGGHAFVCDGYQASTGNFHFNWGWGGEADGYYKLLDLRPVSSGIGGGGYTFNDSQEIIVGIQPARTKEEQAVTAPAPVVAGLISLQSFNEATHEIRVRGLVYTADNPAFEAYRGIGLFEGEKLTAAYGVEQKKISCNGVLDDELDCSYISATIDPAKLTDGEYIISPVWSKKSDKLTDLAAVTGCMGGISQILVSVKDGKITVKEDHSEVSPLRGVAGSVHSSAPLVAFGDKGELTFKVHNSGKFPIYQYIRIGLKNKESGQLFLNRAFFPVHMDPGSDNEISLAFHPNISGISGSSSRVFAPAGEYEPVIGYQIISSVMDNPLVSREEFVVLENLTVSIAPAASEIKNVIMANVEMPKQTTIKPGTALPMYELKLKNIGTNTVGPYTLVATITTAGGGGGRISMGSVKLAPGEETTVAKSLPTTKVPTMQEGLYTFESEFYTILSGSIQRRDGLFGNTLLQILVLNNDNNTSTEHVTVNDRLKVYPIPARSVLYVQGSDDATGVSVYSLQGSLVQQSNMKSGTAQISVEALPAGEYLLKITYADGHLSTRRIAVEE